MTEYTITIDGYKSGLTGKTIEQSMREQFGGPGVDITVSEAQSEISVERRGEYVNVFYDGRLMASLSEKHDELLVLTSLVLKRRKRLTVLALRSDAARRL
jgi:hypothetical protein